MKIPHLTRSGCSDRRTHLLQTLDLDLIVLCGPRNLYYYGGFLPPFPSLSEWGPAFLVLDASDGETTLICHNFAAAAAKDSYSDKSHIWTWYDGTESAVGDIFSTGTKVFGNFLCSKYKTAKIGVDAGFLPMMTEVRGIDFVDISASIANQQRSKDPDEISCICYAQDAALAGHKLARREIRPGMTELDLFNVINAAITKKAGMPVKLIGDIISGPRTLEISGGPTGRVIEADDTVILDLSPVIGGYRADYTATIVLDENPDHRLLDLEKALHAAIEAGKRQLLPGRKAKEVYQAVKKSMDEAGFGRTFTSHAGHGLGLGHPEAPFFVPNSEETLVTNDVVTLEPGSYEPGCAGRIEHVFLITDDGPEQLTSHNTKFTHK